MREASESVVCDLWWQGMLLLQRAAAHSDMCCTDWGECRPCHLQVGMLLPGWGRCISYRSS